MCKLHNCLDNDCHYCKRKAEKAKPKCLKRTPLKKKVYKIKPRSTKRAKQEQEYNKKRKKILAERPICECGRVDENGKVCELPATTIHHPCGRIGELLTDEDNMIPMALPCHIWVELNPLEAKKLGLSKNRIT